MGVVTAGVHTTVLGGEGQARFLLDGQSVHISPKGDGFCRAIIKKSQISGAADLFRLAIQLGETSADIFAGFELLPGCFRNLVQIPTILNQVSHCYLLRSAEKGCFSPLLYRNPSK